MTDLAVRAAERRWRETGAPEDEAAWLVALVRAGRLDPARLERLALAAHVGHPGAALALGRVVDTSDPEATVRDLARFGARPIRNEAAQTAPAWTDELLPRAELALARVAVSAAPPPDAAERGLVQGLLGVVEAWLVAPATGASDRWAELPDAPVARATSSLLAELAATLVIRRAIVRIRDLRRLVGCDLRTAVDAIDRDDATVAAHMARAAVALAGAVAVAAAVRDGLGPWAVHGR